MSTSQINKLHILTKKNFEMDEHKVHIQMSSEYPDYMGRIYKQNTGVTISEMIQKVRIEHSCRLLKSTNRTVADVAASCGFEDVKFFYTVFKRINGISPGEYRKSQI